jgi:hypothetical protein
LIVHRGERIVVAGLEIAQVLREAIDSGKSDFNRTIIALVDVAWMPGEFETLLAIDAVLDHFRILRGTEQGEDSIDPDILAPIRVADAAQGCEQARVFGAAFRAARIDNGDLGRVDKDRDGSGDHTSLAMDLGANQMVGQAVVGRRDHAVGKNYERAEDKEELQPIRHRSHDACGMSGTPDGVICTASSITAEH